MNQYVGITLDIIDYYPQDFDFNNYSFIFISEDKNFDREISYINSNQVCQKILLNKREIKYSIKVTKDDSLIGISEFVIPSLIINKKDKIYDKVCPITMSDSIKKLLFGSVANAIPLKIGIHATLQYFSGGDNKTGEKSEKKEKDKSEKKEKEKSEKKEKGMLVQKNNIKKEKKIDPFTPRKFSNIKDKNINNINVSNNGFSTRLSYNNYNIHNKNNALNSSLNRLPKKGESFLSSKKYIKNTKDQPRTSSSQRQNQSSSKMRSVKNTHRDMLKNKEKREERGIKTEKNEEESKSKKPSTNTKQFKNISNNTSINNFDDNNNVVNKSNIDMDDNTNELEIKNNLDKYIDNNMNKKIDEIEDLNEMRNFTLNNLQNLLNYQMKCYELIKKEIDLCNKYNEQFMEYSEKYRNNLKRINKLKEENNLNKIKQHILLNNEKIYNNKDNDIMNIKDKEFTIIKDIYTTIKGEEINLNNIENINTKNKNEQFLLLFKVLKKIGNKYGPLENILTQSNSTEPQRGNLKKIINKYSKELEPSNNTNIITSNVSSNASKKNIPNIVNNNNINSIDKFEYVSLIKPDEIDKKIELFLRQFYLNHKNTPKIIFKKTSKNNYEYGSQKVMIKMEGEAIRVRYMGGYLLLDKFVELNAPLEEKKKKNTRTSSNKSKKK